jgi:hypothetical protein
MTELRGDLNTPFEGSVGEAVQVVNRKADEYYAKIGIVGSFTCFDVTVMFPGGIEQTFVGSWLKKV